MRKILVLLLALALIPLLLTCEEPQNDDDPGIDFVLADIVGTWNFPDQSGDSDITVEILNPSPMVVFIKWTHAENAYDCYGHGGLEGKVISYTYGYTSTISGSPGPESEVVLNLSITLAYRDGRLKVVCSGEGPLDGMTFEMGVIEVT